MSKTQETNKLQIPIIKIFWNLDIYKLVMFGILVACDLVIRLKLQANYVILPRLEIKEMAICTLCSKRSHIRSWSRHQKGSSGASEWPLRAQIHKNTQKPNLHKFKGNLYCTKCLRIVKPKWVAPARPSSGAKPAEAAATQA